MSFEKYENNTENKESKNEINDQSDKNSIMDKFKDIFGGKQDEKEPSDEKPDASEVLAKQRSDFLDRIKVPDDVKEKLDETVKNFSNSGNNDSGGEQRERTREVEIER